MKSTALVCLLAIASLAAGCASIESLQPGRTMAEVEQQFHAPGARRTEANGNQVWEYDLGPEGRAFWRLSFGPDGRLVSATQELTEENFGKLRAGQTTRDDVMRLIGRPVRTFNFLRINDEVWDYRYMKGAWFMVLSVHFDSARGTVTSYFSEPDPEVYRASDSGF